MTTAEETLFQLVLSLTVAVTTAWVTVWLSLRRFYREKLWESKMGEYTTLLQALHHMNRDVEICIKAEMRGDDEESDYRKEWDRKHRAAWERIREQIDVGEFLYSPSTVRILETLVKDAKTELDEGYLAHLETLQYAVKKCLPLIKGAARIDLELPSSSRILVFLRRLTRRK